MELTSNYKKHSNKNPFSKFLIANFYNTLITLIKNLKPVSILDVGCGEGFTLEKLQKNHIGKRLEGMDNLQDAIDIGKKLHPKFILKKGDVYKLPYRSSSFDLITCTEVFEHLEKPEKALDELIRVSKKYILLSVPNEPLFTMQRFLRGKNVLHLGDHPEHIQHWSAKTFETFVKRKKVRVIAGKTPFPWTMLLIKKI
ncbi:MAG TPA: class I SAM-dependent methyltransferase [Candidatus Saccharimonadales bacterium]|nr:class I SAM-dependent methyltransferase [Candidatus Saccharimonadales bacterium]